jgi:hypothetical protein
VSTTEELQAAIEHEKARRRESEREIQATKPLLTEAASLWRRIQLRRQQNGFGEDFEIALTRRT